MKRFAAVAALLLAAVLTWAPGAGATTEGVCPDNGTKVNVDGEHESITVTAPEGKLIAGWCVKAGSIEQGDGPEFVVVDPPAAEVTITHSSGKDISHYTVTLVDVVHGLSVVYGRECVRPSDTEAVTVATIRFANDTELAATVEVLGQSLELAAFDQGTQGIVLVPVTLSSGAVSVPWKVTWVDGFVEEGTIELVPYEHSCVPVCPEQVNGPLCPPAPTYPPTTTTVAAPAVTTTAAPPTGVGSSAVASPSPGDGELAFTGGGRDLILIGVGVLIAGGGLVSFSTWTARRRRA